MPSVSVRHAAIVQLQPVVAHFDCTAMRCLPCILFPFRATNDPNTTMTLSPALERRSGGAPAPMLH